MEKEIIEIPFGAKDSELGGFEYTIPEGFEAEIIDGKVIVRKAESEDKRIRKDIHTYLYNELHNIQQLTPRTNEFERWLAWLEKQKLLNEKEIFKAGYTEGFEDGVRDAYIKSEEQKPVDLPKGEDYGIDGLYHAIRILENTLGKVDGYQTDDGILEHKCAISAVKSLYEQKTAWSEEDEKMFRTIISDGIRGAELDKAQIDWFKSLKGRVQPQPKYEVDEQIETIAMHLDNCGDTAMAEILRSCNLRPQKQCDYNPYKEVVESIAEMCKHYDKASHSGLRDFYDNVKIKCKDAKEYDSLFPQNTWKPSEEQMKCLDNVKGSDDHTGYVLDTLYNDLKKLKG